MFSGDAKDEIARAPLARACCPETFVRALAAFSSAKGRATIVRTERAAVARAALAAAKRARIPACAHPEESRRFRERSVIAVEGAAPLWARPSVPTRRCCLRAWLRAAFLACGSVGDPRCGYHLEFFCRDRLAARRLRAALAKFAVAARQATRRGRPLLYVKGAQPVADLLGSLGASRALLRLADIRAVRATKNSIQRSVNGMTANAARAAKASARQKRAALRVLKAGTGRGLTPALREAAKLRIAHPERTLAELAASARPTVTKAAMGWRLRTLELRALELRAAPGPGRKGPARRQPKL